MTNNTTFPGTLTCPTSSVSNAMTMGTTKTYVVTMTNASGANKYYIDGYLQASLVLHQGQTYIFDLSSSTLSGHPFEFSTTNNGSHGGGSAYSTGITTTGTYADDQTRKFVVSTSTPTTLYYYCTAHSGMGGSVTISPKAELIVSGGAEFIGTGTIKLPSGTTSERPTTGMTGMIRYNTTTGFIETYTAEGWGSIAPPPVITGISPTSVAGADTATQVFTVTGTGFDTGITIKLVGANGTEYSVFNATRVSGQSATFKMGANGASGGYDVAQRPFNVKVTGGDSASAVTSTSADSIALAAPTIASDGVSPTTFASTASNTQTITVTGTNFTSSMASGNKVQVLGADGSTLYNVDSAAVASATSITFKLAATGSVLTTGQLDNRPYKVRITDDVGITATSTQTVNFNGIAWTSPASGATLTYNNGVSSSQNLVATDDLGGTDVTFSITSGSVAGLSLGSATASPATYGGSGTTDGTTNVTFRVTDNESGTTADRTFSIAVTSELYSFSSHTFTNAGVTGRIGPTLNQLKTAYSPAAPWTNYTANLNVITQGYQLWTVPKTGKYTIDAYGGAGGNQQAPHVWTNGSSAGGHGGRAYGDFNLTKGTKINIVVGNKAADQAPDAPDGAPYHAFAYGTGGGGGTFVFLENGQNAPRYDQSVYVVAGGGGGAGGAPTHGGAADVGGNAGASQAGTGGQGGSAGAYSEGAGAGWFGDSAYSRSEPDTYGTDGKDADDGFIGGGLTTWGPALNWDIRDVPTGSGDPNSLGGFGGGGSGSLYLGGGGGGFYGGSGSSAGPGNAGTGGGSRSNAGESQSAHAPLGPAGGVGFGFHGQGQDGKCIITFVS